MICLEFTSQTIHLQNTRRPTFLGSAAPKVPAKMILEKLLTSCSLLCVSTHSSIFRGRWPLNVRNTRLGYFTIQSGLHASMTRKTSIEWFLTTEITRSEDASFDRSSKFLPNYCHAKHEHSDDKRAKISLKSSGDKYSSFSKSFLREMISLMHKERSRYKTSYETKLDSDLSTNYFAKAIISPWLW